MPKWIVLTAFQGELVGKPFQWPEHPLKIKRFVDMESEDPSRFAEQFKTETKIGVFTDTRALQPFDHNGKQEWARIYKLTAVE